MKQEDIDFRDAWIEDVLKKGPDQIKLELQDLWNLMDINSKVIYLLSDGILSKSNYTFEVFKEFFDKKIQEIEDKKDEEISSLQNKVILLRERLPRFQKIIDTVFREEVKDEQTNQE